jgi:hypothetical protein
MTDMAGPDNGSTRSRRTLDPADRLAAGVRGRLDSTPRCLRSFH